MSEQKKSAPASTGRDHDRSLRPVRGRLGWLSLALMVVAAGGLGGCGDRMLETGAGYGYFFNDPPPDLDPAPPIRRITGQNQEYPVLGTVPARPPSPPTVAERQERLSRLQGDARTGHLADQVLKEEAPQPGPPPGFIVPPDTGPSLLQSLGLAPGQAGATATPATPGPNAAAAPAALARPDKPETN